MKLMIACDDKSLIKSSEDSRLARAPGIVAKSPQRRYSGARTCSEKPDPIGGRPKERTKLQIPSSKFQDEDPNSKDEEPSSKFQAPNSKMKTQIPNTKTQIPRRNKEKRTTRLHPKIEITTLSILGIWNLELGIWDLVFGAWNLGFSIWSLDFGALDFKFFI